MFVFTEPISSGRSGLPVLAEDRTGGLQFDGITQRGTRPVRLEIVNLPARQTGAAQRVGDNLLLCTAIRHRQTTRRTVLIHGAAPDHRTNLIAVANRVVDALEHHHAAAFAAHIAIGGGVERLAPPVGGQHSRPGEVDHRDGGQDHIHAADQRHVAITGVEPLAGLVHGHQR